VSAVGHGEPSLEHRVAQLRSTFDNAFALPLAPPQPDGVELLIVSAGGQTYAIRTSELAGVEVDRKLVPLPSAARPGLLGLCAAQGELVPVFELAAVLGGQAAKTSPRWLALHLDKQLVALAFDELRESRRVAVQDLSPLELAPGRGAFSRHATRLDIGVIHVLDIPAVISSLRQSQQQR
jgi:chemotaxis signal transduction protein